MKTGLIALGLALSFATAALPHAKKETTAPADGAELDAAPEVVEMRFDSPITITMFALRGADGEEIDIERGAIEPVTVFEAVPAEIGSGTFTVEWRGLSEDGHPVQGSFSFAVK